MNRGEGPVEQPAAGRADGRTTQETYGLPPILTADQVADFLGVHKVTVYEAIKGRQFPGRRVGRRVVILRDALLDWLRSNDRVVPQRRSR